MKHGTRRPLATTAAALGAALLVVLGTATTASAHGDLDRIRAAQAQYGDGQQIPLVTSANVRHVAAVPGSAGISGCFMKTAPLFVTSNLDSVKVYGVKDPLHPTLLGTLPSLHFENEAMNCGERRTKTGIERFVMIGVDLYQASPGDIQHVNAGGRELVIVDVSDPANPHIRSRTAGTTSTHTVTCVVSADCRYAYSAGSRTTFSIFDLRRLNKPVEVDSDPATAGVQPFATPTGGHKWNFDNAGYGTHTGWNGSSIWDVSHPRNPEVVTTTGDAGKGTDPKYPGWNDFIHHNSFRPNADAFVAGAKPSVSNGNVLLVTEEDYEQTDCTQAGSFQTWWVKRLDGTPGAIVPLDKVEISDLGTFPLPQGAFCSAHWFDYNPAGIVAAGFYGGGTQFIDVRNPRDIKSWGYATWGASEVWDTYWVPVYRHGRMKAARTNIAYSVDAVRGIDVYSVDLPGSATGAVPGVSLSAATPFGLSWPRDAVPMLLVGAGLLTMVGLRRRQVTGARVQAGRTPR